MLQVSQLFIYPIKSLAGIELASASVTDRGFEHDRRWMLVDADNRFLSQRQHSQMALIKTAITHQGIAIHHINQPDAGITVPFAPKSNEDGVFTIWDDTCYGQFVGDDVDEWFSETLRCNCRLVYMPDATRRETSRKHHGAANITSLSDAYPFLLLGDATLANLNNKLERKLPFNRFRPNIVFSGGEAHLEDSMAHIRIGNVDFYGVKQCGRCNVITIDQETALQSKEPTRTLATYRTRGNMIYFGQNLVHKGGGSVKVGDHITVLQIKEPLI